MRLLIVLSLLIVGCATKRPYVSYVSEEALAAKNIKIGHGVPNENMELLGEVVAISGHGCGGFGTIGNLNEAYNILKVRAYTINADYVQILSVVEPHYDIATFCIDNEYKISGMAFKILDKQ